MVEQRIELPIGRLAPGRYLLTVSVRTGLAPTTSDERRQLVLLVGQEKGVKESSSFTPFMSRVKYE